MKIKIFSAKKFKQLYKSLSYIDKKRYVINNSNIKNLSFSVTLYVFDVPNILVI